MENLVKLLYDFNGLKIDMLFEARQDKNFCFLNNKSLDEHFSIHDNDLYFWYNVAGDTTAILKRDISQIIRTAELVRA